jgi:CheY-like chemotaxis protein
MHDHIDWDLRTAETNKLSAPPPTPLPWTGGEDSLVEWTDPFWSDRSVGALSLSDTGTPSAPQTDPADELLEELWGPAEQRFGDVDLALDLSATSDLPFAAARASAADAATGEGWDIPSEYLSRLFAVAESAAPRILYLENDAQHAQEMRRALTATGFRVNCCPDANWLQPTLGSFDPDLILVDIPRPDACTLDLLRCLWAGRRSASVPVVLVRKEGPAPPEATTRWLGFDVVDQPASAEALVMAITARLHRAQALQQMFSA